jgi:hypothetical protein
MIRNEPGNGAPREIGLRRQEIVAEVLREDAGEYVQRAVQHANPGGEEVQVTTPSRWAPRHEWERQIEDRGSSHGTRFAPVKTRMSEENGDAADEQAKEAQRIDPVGDADDSRVPRRIENI